MSELDIEKINSLATADPCGFIRSAEKKYKELTEKIAEDIAKNEEIRLVLLAGPSGSGKTTTANLLADDLRLRGLDALVLSLDNFYRDATDPEYPRLANGERDFEAVEALDLPALQKALSAVSSGESFSVPHYDFKLGTRSGEEKHCGISHGCVIIEGIHALNPKIHGALPKNRILRIFISVSTNINKDGRRIISGRKLRFVRRMVRDSIYRAADAERTLGMWDNVLAGEERYLYPYRALADVDFNTFHDFELCVMKHYVEELISEQLAASNGYAAAVLSAMKAVVAVDEALVPDDSLIREFIRGGKYESLY